MKIALLGSSGYLGQAYLRAPVPTGLNLVPVQRNQIAYHDPTVLRNFIRNEKINAIALTGHCQTGTTLSTSNTFDKHIVKYSEYMIL